MQPKYLCYSDILISLFSFKKYNTCMPGTSTHILIVEKIVKKLEGMDNWPFEIEDLNANKNSLVEIYSILNENSHQNPLC